MSEPAWTVEYEGAAFENFLFSLPEYEQAVTDTTRSGIRPRAASRGRSRRPPRRYVSGRKTGLELIMCYDT